MPLSLSALGPAVCLSLTPPRRSSPQVRRTDDAFGRAMHEQQQHAASTGYCACCELYEPLVLVHKDEATVAANGLATPKPRINASDMLACMSIRFPSLPFSCPSDLRSLSFPFVLLLCPFGKFTCVLIFFDGFATSVDLFFAPDLFSTASEYLLRFF